MNFNEQHGAANTQPVRIYVTCTGMASHLRSNVRLGKCEISNRGKTCRRD